MLKSTYQKAEAVSEQPAALNIGGLPAGWTAHKAPSGHTYYYNAETKKSTYVKPEAEAPRVSIPSFAAAEYAEGFQQNNFYAPHAYPSGHGGAHNALGANRRQQRREPEDRPKHRYVIPACKPWVLVKTKLGRRFVHNPETGESLWRFPEDVLLAVTEWDAKERERQERRERGELSEPEDVQSQASTGDQDAADSSSEYTEVEVTDSEDEQDKDGDSAPAKRQRTEEPVQEGPIEFNEDDLMAEMAEMEEYGYEDDWQGEEEDPLSEEDARLLFYELLEDFNTNPFSTWDKVVEEGKVIEDDRYRALPNMKARRTAWDEWSKQRIQELREKRAKQEKKDPRIPYLAFLQEHASMKLYWPEFKRKYRKEPVMKDLKFPDKEKEKLYREHLKRLQLSQSTLKSEFTALLKSLPLSALNKNTSLTDLPADLISNLRYISLPSSLRDSLLETYLSTLAPAPLPEDGEVEDEAEGLARRDERKRREDALRERERQVAEAKRRQRRDVAYGKGQLRDQERELEQAMHVDKSGLRGSLLT